MHTLVALLFCLLPGQQDAARNSVIVRADTIRLEGDKFFSYTLTEFRGPLTESDSFTFGLKERPRPNHPRDSSRFVNGRFIEPFCPGTSFGFYVPRDSARVAIEIWNLSDTLHHLPIVEASLRKGKHLLSLGASGLKSGVYFLKQTIDELTIVKRFLLLK